MPSMVEGIHGEIVYVAADGTARWARTTAPNGSAGAQWIIRDTPNGTGTPFTWMEFLATSGSQRRVRFESGPIMVGAYQQLKTDFVHCRLDGSRQRQEDQIWLRDPAGGEYRLGMSRMDPPWNTPLSFHVNYH
jgi:hypothetical protein